eukprot:TRINITY_DN47558_c0_g1_i1.p1 TRINITY_DN47558_c0_g1~~TRINITY_DN47558_c0_g1_i1.p1  ORF type:complete len:271 (+),score=23.95 TRINITY_DN47558_c0_g1_i1:58-870(+)
MSKMGSKNPHNDEDHRVSRLSGTVTRFDGERCWGFIKLENGIDAMVHIQDCKPTDVNLFTGGQPAPGDIVTCEIEPRPSNPNHMQAKRVIGGTAERHCNIRGKGEIVPEKGDGQFCGIVKAWSIKHGAGWITCTDGTDAWGEISDVIATRPCTGDVVQFDLIDRKDMPGQKQAIRITGGTAPIQDEGPLSQRQTRKFNAARNSIGHLPGCVCAECSASNPAPRPVVKKAHLPGCFCAACRSNQPKVPGLQMQQQRPGPYNSGFGSMGRLY